MTGTKPKRRSVTIISAGVTIAALIAGQVFGMTIGDEAQAELVDLIASAVAIGGGVGAWWGRVRATQEIE